MSISTIRHLRSERRFNEAIDELVRVCREETDSFQITAVLREFIRGGKCLVLEWAAFEKAHKRGHELQPRIQQLRTFVRPNLWAHDQFSARLNLIEAATSDPQRKGDSTASRLRGAVRAMAEAVSAAWGYQQVSQVKELETMQFLPTPDEPCNGPSFLQYIESDDLRRTFHDLAEEFGWIHPGLLLAGETLAALEGKYERADIKTSNWVMFAASDKATNTCEGVLARLTMERIPKGNSRGGFLLADPFGCGSLFMESTFSSGLQHAWIAMSLADKGSAEHDWRWRIDVEEATRDTPLSQIQTMQIRGRSAEGAITCAMLAVSKGDELDRYTCMSACLLLDRDANVQSTLQLDNVTDLDVKTLATRLQAKKIRTLLVCEKQSDAEKDTGYNAILAEVTTVFAALERFCIWPLITHAVRKRLLEEATKERAALCGPPIPNDQQEEFGLDFVRPPISLRDSERPTSDSEPLSREDLVKFKYGTYRPRHLASNEPIRLQLLAESGMGKTVQLLICEQAIAGDETDRIPIRIGKRASIRRLHNVRTDRSLDTIEWSGRLSKNLEQLARLLKPLVPEELKEKTTEWVERLVKMGRFVFLLDALDQQRHPLRHLATFLATDEVSKCPAIVAGRENSLSKRCEVFSEQPWECLELQQLGKTEQEQYLGFHAADQLIPKKKKPFAWYDEKERRRHQWKELLPTPLLLSMMKELALIDFEGETWLADIPNRFALYQHGARLLFRKGLRSLDRDQQYVADEVELHLKDVALFMVRRHIFGPLEGPNFRDWKTQSALSAASLHGMLQDMVQIDLVREYAFLDRVELDELGENQLENGIEWRHRSFQEYYAALALSELWKDHQSEARNILKEVHQCLDLNGKYCTWPHDNSRDSTIQTGFRSLPADWQSTLRFLLAAVDDEARDEIALELIMLNNAATVALALQQDGLRLDQRIDVLSRWLVHANKTLHCDFSEILDRPNPDWTASGDGQHIHESIDKERAKDAFDSLLLDNPRLAERLVDQRTRDAGILANLWALNPPASVRPVWQQVTPERKTALAGYLSTHRWIRIPDHPDVWMSDFPVTNDVYESFCATHRRDRSQYSPGDDFPVTYVSWHMAMEFCVWLTQLARKQSEPDGADFAHWTYRLPTVEEWYSACNFGSEDDLSYWWGDSMLDELCWYGFNKDGGPAAERTRSRAEAIAAFDAAASRHPSWQSPDAPGILDALGNVWEWSLDLPNGSNGPGSTNSDRILLGGGYRSKANKCKSRAWTNRPALSRQFCTGGFRVCRERSTGER